MSAESVRARLAARGCTWPAPIEQHAELASTNDAVRVLARAGAPAFTAVIADRQTAGRGRHGRRWSSPAGNLHLSLLLRPTLAPESRPLLPLVAGLAVAEALAETGVDARVKWPNDVIVGGRKLAGVLAEASSAGGQLEWVVLGVGANVAADPAASDPSLRGTATSLAAETGTAPELADLAAAVLSQLLSRYAQLEAGQAEALVEAWRARSLPWWGREVEVISGDDRLRGRAVALDARGALVLERADGSRVAVLSGEARELRLANGR